MKLLCMISVVMVFFALPALIFADDRKATELCNKFEQQINAQAANGNYLDAIIAASNYEQDMLALYPPPSLKHATFTSAAYHVHADVPFLGFVPIPLDVVLPPDGVVGEAKLLLRLEHPRTKDVMILITFDMNAVFRRRGEPLNSFDDEVTKNITKNLLADAGKVTKQSFTEIGIHRALISELSVPSTKHRGMAISVVENSHIFLFVVFTHDGDSDENIQRLQEMVKSLTFSYLPSNTVEITRIRRMEAGNEVSDILATIRKLIEIGEYAAASEDISRLRALFGGKLPLPQIKANVLMHPTFGFSFKNPDPARWKMKTERTAGADIIVLLDTSSTKKTELIFVISHLYQLYNPCHAKAINSTKQENAVLKQTLQSLGESTLEAIGTGPISGEHFIQMKGIVAYEGTVSDNRAGSRKTVMVFVKNNAMFTLEIIAPEKQFDAKAALCKTILDKYMTIE